MTSNFLILLFICSLLCFLYPTMTVANPAIHNISKQRSFRRLAQSIIFILMFLTFSSQSGSGEKDRSNALYALCSNITGQDGCGCDQHETNQVHQNHSKFAEKYAILMSTEQTPVFFAAPKYPAMLSKLAKGRTESYGDSARGPTWQSHEQRFPAALQ